MNHQSQHLSQIPSQDKLLKKPPLPEKELKEESKVEVELPKPRKPTRKEIAE